MVDASLPPGWHDTVRQHHGETAGYVVAQTGDCLDLQAQERKHPKGRVRGRDFQPLPTTGLATLKPPASWFLGIILCPGDDLEPILEWYLTLPSRDRDRVTLFVHPQYSKDAVDETWGRRGAPAPQTVPLGGTLEHFHHVTGVSKATASTPTMPPRPDNLATTAPRRAGLDPTPRFLTCAVTS